MTMKTQNWYSSWFDSPYYHILYSDRDDEEAHGFMQRLTNFLKLKKGMSILDLACGKGRHSVYLNKLGFEVTGVDLSENSIAHAKKFENDSLRFKVHDMREAFGKKPASPAGGPASPAGGPASPAGRFDAVFNLFTSFGYFDDPNDNFRTINAIKNDMAASGYGVIDFMNVNFVEKNLVPSETKTTQGIHFHIKRWMADGFVMKQIDFQDDGQKFSFVEKVKAVRLQNFEFCFSQIGLRLKHIFGDYNLGKFELENSPRLILIFQQ